MFRRKPPITDILVAVITAPVWIPVLLVVLPIAACLDRRDRWHER